MFYLHPWELDPGQPRPPMAWRHRFRHYVGVEQARGQADELSRALPLRHRPRRAPVQPRAVAAGASPGSDHRSCRPVWRGGMTPTPGDPHLAHAPEWAAVIQRAYGHEPLYLDRRRRGGRTAVLPAFIVRRPLVRHGRDVDAVSRRRRSVQLHAEVAGSLVDSARGRGAPARRRLVELRCTQRLAIPWEPAEHKVNMMLPLPANPDVAVAPAR